MSELSAIEESKCVPLNLLALWWRARSGSGPAEVANYLHGAAMTHSGDLHDEFNLLAEVWHRVTET